MKKLKLMLQIYITFFKLGSVSFGGGYAILSLIEREVVETKKWVDKEEIVDIFAVSQSLPGAIALNASTFVGYSIAGIQGAISALLGNLTPSVSIMLVLSMLLNQFSENPYIQSAFNGIIPVIVGLILYAAFQIGKTAMKDKFSIIICILTFVLAIVFQISVLFIIIGGIGLGILIYIVKIIARIPMDENDTKGGN